jgi:hypothetical protein
METRWVPGVNNLGDYGRWAFAEFDRMIGAALVGSGWWIDSGY